MKKVNRERKSTGGPGGGIGLLESVRTEMARREGAPRKSGGTHSPGRQKDEARRRYVSTLAHEVRAPLAAIRNYSDVLLNCPPADEEQRRSFLKAIAEESDRLNRLLDELNLLEKIENDSEPFRPTPADLGDAATTAVLGLHPLAARKRIEVHLDGLDEAPLVWGEPNLIARAATALVENAIKFSLPGGEVKVTLSADFAARTASLTVDDQGIGVSDGMEQRIFEKFAQVAVPPDEISPRGSGIGLTLTRLIAERHAGRVTLVRKERGSVFRLELPLCT